MGLVTEGNNLFVIDIDYIVPFDQVKQHLDPHLDFVRDCYAQGHFLMSGAKVPRTGGMVIAQGPSTAEIEALMAHDPFCTAGIVALTITEFTATNLADALK